MDRMVEEIGGFYPTQPDWDWLWATMWFCPDPESWPPRDMGGCCHSPLEAILAAAPQLYRGVNAYGPAMGLDNDTNPTAWGGYYQFEGTALEMGQRVNTEWTAAFVAQKWGSNYGLLNMASFVAYLGAQHRFYYNTDIKKFRYQFASQSVMDGEYSPLFDEDRPCAFVFTSSGDGNNRMYADGRLIAERSSGSALIVLMTVIRIGGHPSAKQPKCWGGTIGPFVLSRHAWSHAQAAQWSADPWGFLRPSVAPILPQWRQPWEALICDVQTRPAVTADARTRAAVAADVQTRVAVMTDVLTRAAVVCDVDLRAAVVADAQARAAVDGGVQTRAAVIADARTRAAVIADAQARAAAIADAQARAAVAADAQARAAVSGDAQIQED